MAIGTLSALLARVAPGRHSDRRRVTVEALGRFEVHIDGTPVRQLGGHHAGARQAAALFAALFDAGSAGVIKDDILELLWPESDLAKADLAFHRTLGGLRRVLSPRRPAAAITHDVGRYRLAPGLIADSDVLQFERLLGEAAHSTGDKRVCLLETALHTYRGDYLDDCPYYGDSAQVEARREALRRTYLEANEELTAAYAEGGLTSLSLLRAFEAQRFAPLHGGWVVQPTGGRPRFGADPGARVRHTVGQAGVG